MSLYNPSGATSAVKSSGVEIRKGDFTKPETLDSAFAGADKLLIVSYPSIAYEIRVQSHKAAIEAAKRCGIKHVYYTSLAFAGDSAAAVMKAHLETEAYLKGSGMTYTIIREGIYNESWPLYFGFFDVSQKKKEVVIPISDGKIAWVCRDDLGEGTAKIMTSVGTSFSFNHDIWQWIEMDFVDTYVPRNRGTKTRLFSSQGQTRFPSMNSATKSINDSLNIDKSI